MILGNEKIIVLRHFTSLIEANITKTKLDAYGIPCFLTEEHVTHLTTPLLSGGIRLHIFERDQIQAEEVLQKDYLAKSDDCDILECPRCHSKKIFVNRKSSNDNVLNATVYGFLMGLTRTYYCQDCNTEFDD